MGNARLKCSTIIKKAFKLPRRDTIVSRINALKCGCLTVFILAVLFLGAKPGFCDLMMITSGDYYDASGGHPAHGFIDVDYSDPLWLFRPVFLNFRIDGLPAYATYADAGPIGPVGAELAGNDISGFLYWHAASVYEDLTGHTVLAGIEATALSVGGNIPLDAAGSSWGSYSLEVRRVPEPSGMLLLGTGLLIGWLTTRRLIKR